jgi:hypothetical protein
MTTTTATYTYRVIGSDDTLGDEATITVDIDPDMQTRNRVEFVIALATGKHVLDIALMRRVLPVEPVAAERIQIVKVRPSGIDAWSVLVDGAFVINAQSKRNAADRWAKKHGVKFAEEAGLQARTVASPAVAAEVAAAYAEADAKAAGGAATATARTAAPTFAEEAGLLF